MHKQECTSETRIGQHTQISMHFKSKSEEKITIGYVHRYVHLPTSAVTGLF